MYLVLYTSIKLYIPRTSIRLYTVYPRTVICKKTLTPAHAETNNNTPLEADVETAEPIQTTNAGYLDIAQTEVPRLFNSNADIIAYQRAESKRTAYATRIEHNGYKLNWALYNCRAALALVTSILDLIRNHHLHKDLLLREVFYGLDSESVKGQTMTPEQRVEGRTITPEQRVAFDALVQRFTALSELMPLSEYIEVLLHYGSEIWPVVHNLGRGGKYNIYYQRCLNAHNYLVGSKHPDHFVSWIFKKMRIFPRLEVELCSMIAVLEDFIPDVEALWGFDVTEADQDTRVGWVKEGWSSADSSLLRPRNRPPAPTPPPSEEWRPESPIGGWDGSRHEEIEAHRKMLRELDDYPDSDDESQYGDYDEDPEATLWTAQCEARQEINEVLQVGRGTKLFTTVMQASWVRQNIAKLRTFLNEWHHEHPELPKDLRSVLEPPKDRLSSVEDPEAHSSCSEAPLPDRVAKSPTPRTTALSELPQNRYGKSVWEQLSSIHNWASLFWPVLYDSRGDLYAQRCRNAHEYLAGGKHPTNFVEKLREQLEKHPMMEAELVNVIEVLEDFVPDIQAQWMADGWLLVEAGDWS
ncbi:hypothetical protein BU16DRAFT_539415 [Lophium mytilinum]|uniref:Uncharacterized protein n=1 Tax=Lophium mytilinum TaxID=390894 RepID=A0A6A6QU29_9PEZI|nr:hypothetical protein BU16DRAFT_539415 [Lophium mytilinum]